MLTWRIHWRSYYKHKNPTGDPWVERRFGAATPPLTVRCQRPADSAAFWHLAGVPDYVNFQDDPLPVVTLAFRNNGHTTWRRGQHVIRALHSISDRYPELEPLPVDAVAPGEALRMQLPLRLNVEKCNPSKSVSVQWMMATIHGVPFGEVSAKKEVYCSGLPCVEYTWKNVVSGTTFMRNSTKLLEQFASRATPARSPRIVHQSWMSNLCTWDQRRWISSWLEHHPDWLYVFWSDRENRDLVERHAQQYLPVYSSFLSDIYRADFIRYVILDLFGGVYADSDVQALQSLDALVMRHDAFVGVEPSAHSLFFYGQNQTLCNAIMGSKKGHPFWAGFMQFITRRMVELVHADVLNSKFDVIELTGPRAMQDYWDQYSQSTGGAVQPLTVLDDINFMPLVAYYQRHRLQGYCRELGNVLVPAAAEECRRLEANDYVGKEYSNETYTVHHWTCSWCK
eukprot:m.1565877 g.1565877  ORF g.1565877 m.1565877 type:complete len:453 (-) comp25288_c1_seq19:1672-3030(-)